MSDFDIRLVAYAPNGGRLGPLPHSLSIELGQPYDDLPSLRIDYTTHAPGAEFLASPCEVAVQMYDPAAGEWRERPDSRFLRIKRSGDLTDRTGSRSYELPGYGWQLRKLKLYPSEGGGDTEGKRRFSASTVGTILRTWLNEGHARGAVPGVETDFDTAVDSAGAGWSTLLTLEYDLGADLLSVLNGLTDQGVCDWRFEGRTLRVFNPDSAMAVDRASGESPVDLRLGRDVTEAPDSGSLEEAVSHLLLEGDEGFRLEVSNPDAATPWGRWEEYLTQGGVTDEGTARLLAGAALERGARERVQITRGLVFTEARWLPWRDYRPGDHVLAPDADGTMRSLRLRQITLSRDQNGALTGNAVLNDRFLEAEIRRGRRTASLVGGSVADGGSGGRPAREGNDRRRPAAPEGLIADTVAYIDADGAARGQVTLTWSPVDSATDGTAMDVGSYQVYARPNTTGAPWRRLTSVDHPDTVVWTSDLPVDEELAFKVRATGRHNGLAGPFGAQTAVTVAGDVEPPPVPPAPELSTRLGVINVGWDGLGAGGERMPRDFFHTLVEMRDGQTWEEEWDQEGPLPEPWQVAYGDEGDLRVEGGQLLRDDPSVYVTVYRDVGVLDQEYTVVVHAPEAEPAGTVRLWSRYDIDNPGGYAYNYTPEVGSGAHLVRVRMRRWRHQVWIDGVQVQDTALTPDGARLVTGIGLSLRDGDVRLGPVRGPEGGDWHRIGVLEGGPATLVVPGQPYNEPRFFRLATVDRSGNVSDPGEEAWTQTTPLVDTDIYPEIIRAGHIEANAITADKIAAGSIEAGHIGADAVQAGHIAADAIDGKVITGAVVRSSPPGSGARWEATGSGIRFTDASGRTTFHAGTTGDVTAVGRFRTGHTGNRVWIDGNLRGRPRMELHTGDSSQAQPNVFSLGQSSDGFPSGALVVSGREAVVNSSGRSDLVIEHGTGGAALKYQHGTYAGIGLEFKWWDLFLQGRITSGQGRLDTFTWYRSSASTGSSLQWELTYGTAAANGGRLLMPAGHATNSWGRPVVATTVAQYRGSAFVHSYLPEGSARHRIQCVSVWVNQDVGGA
ncbi:hypothetical protein DFP74_3273 [Nocardiopsis sp. Huas11]|uniref:hypothetical protein n=1 Tax=Nocardiopsis sp. Huas11 TaxID=2183912 RepID=UPI000EB03434|nr:hypothetical protein [Nocardiopsis sp. Huas11]RKS07595.1 hypothetical protein DFP74_3273 [Nocardiopsis sp. Huas11]